MENQLVVCTLPTSHIDNLSPSAKLFYHFHGVQMIGSDFPTHLIENLYLKLTENAYDGGEFLQIIDNQDQQTYQVRAKKHITTHSNVFVIDHALTFRYPELRKILRQNTKMIDRLQAMLKYQQEKVLPGVVNETAAGEGEELELQDMQLLQVSALEFPKTLITLSLMNNRLQNAEEIINKLQYLNLRVLWLNGNPVADNADLRTYIQNKTRIELLNSKFTKNCGEWGIKYAHSKNIAHASNTPKHEIYTLNLDNRNIFAIDLSVFDGFTNLRSISLKNHQIKDKADLQKLFKILSIPTLNFIYVDQQVQKALRESYKNGELDNKIADRVLINKHSFKQDLVDEDVRIDAICERLFRIAGCYRLASTQKLDESSCWYIQDELGSFIPHSDTPKVKIIPFLFAPNNKLDESVVAYSVMWPIDDIATGQLVTRDYLNGMKENRQRSTRLAAWFTLPSELYLKQIEEYDTNMFNLTKASITLMQKFYGTNAIKQRETAGRQLQSWEDKFQVISDYEYINKYLKHPRFQIVDSIEKAKIVWLVGAAEEEEWARYKGKYLFNQFPFESCIVLKHNLANTVQSVFGDTKFLQRTYDLEKQLPLFVGDYYRREKEGRDNLWILKPPNMARSMDMMITDNLPLIIRAMETGPKIAQKYISKPVLRRDRKVDLRYILLVKSISPLKLFLYKNFWIRSANNAYTLDRRHLSTYETQFTVMNYGKVSGFEQIKYKDFIDQFQKDYKVEWSSINQKIKKMLRNVFIAVATKYPQMHDDKSRAVYGIDIMVDSQDMQPKLLQITFSPDCKRACEYYPTFYDQIFQTLFLQSMSQNMQRII